MTEKYINIEDSKGNILHTATVRKTKIINLIELIRNAELAMLDMATAVRKRHDYSDTEDLQIIVNNTYNVIMPEMLRMIDKLKKHEIAINCN